MTIGLVLGGGGARGTFEVGALSCLFSEFGVEPAIISGSSAGAMIGMKLAESRSLPGLIQATAELREFMLSLTAAEIFVEQPWLQTFDHTGLSAALDAMLGDRRSSSHEERERAEHGHPHGLAGVLARNLFEYLPRIPRAVLDWKGHSASLLSIAPLRARLRGENGHPAFLHPERVARSGMRLRLATVCLETGETRYVTESGVIVSDDDTRCATPADEPVDLIAAALASAAIPALFEPVRLAGQTYVDGGVRQSIPVEIAIRAGADRLFTIANTPLATAPSTTAFERANLLAILHRAHNVVSHHELLRGNLRGAAVAGVPNTVIMPTIYTVGLVEINRGLMRIGWDYGYLRAGDAAADLSAGDRARAMRDSDVVVALRCLAWRLEEECAAERADEGATPMPADLLKRLRAYKWLIARAVGARAALGVPMPPDASGWPREWEWHATPLVPRTPWEDARIDDHPAEPIALVEETSGAVALVRQGKVLPGDGPRGSGEAGGIAELTVPFGTIDMLRDTRGSG